MTSEQTKILEKVENAFVPLVKEVFSDKLVSVILYGSAVKGQFTDKISDVNVLILIADDIPDGLASLGRKTARLIWKNRIRYSVYHVSCDEGLHKRDRELLLYILWTIQCFSLHKIQVL